MKINHTQFFDGFKQNFDPSLTQAQVDGIEFLLTSFENDPQWTNVRCVAYAFATIYHETNGSMQPVEEGYYLGSPERVHAFQKTLRYYPYFGRGYVQLTWDSGNKLNYDHAGAAIGVDLKHHPELALEKNNAFKIMTWGMFTGAFTGHKLTQFITANHTDYHNAREVINGLDKAALIAGYARLFESILNNSTIHVENFTEPIENPTSELNSTIPVPPVVDTPPVAQTETTPPPANQQDVNTPATVDEVKLYNGIGFIPTIKNDLMAIGAGNLSFQGVSSYLQAAQGWPPWVVPVVVKLALIVAALSGVWLLIRVGHYTIFKIGEYWRRHTETLVKTNTSRKDVIYVNNPSNPQ